MPRSSIASLIYDWENLIATAQASGGAVPGLEAHIEPLTEVLVQVRQLNALQDTRKGIRQQGTQERRELLQSGKDLASLARSALTAHFGFRNPRLTEFGARPVKTRKPPKSTNPPAPPPPEVEVEAQKNKEPEPAKPPTPAAPSTATE